MKGGVAMIEIFETKEYMTVTEAKERFYPLAFVMTNCKVESNWPVEGYLVAAESSEEDYDELDGLETRLSRDKSNGEVYLITTHDPMEGEWICVGDLYV